MDDTGSDEESKGSGTSSLLNPGNIEFTRGKVVNAFLKQCPVHKNGPWVHQSQASTSEAISVKNIG